MTLTIELDNYVFELKSKDPNAYLNRGVVHILSTNKTEIDTNIQKYTDILEQFKIKNQTAGRKKRKKTVKKN